MHPKDYQQLRIIFHVNWILSNYVNSSCDASLSRSLIYIDDQCLQRSVEILTIQWEEDEKLLCFYQKNCSCCSCRYYLRDINIVLVSVCLVVWWMWAWLLVSLYGECGCLVSPTRHFPESSLEVVDIIGCSKSTCMASNYSGMCRRVGSSGLRITPAQPTEAGRGNLFGAASFVFAALRRYRWDRLYFGSVSEPYAFDGHRMRLFCKQGLCAGSHRTRSSDVRTQHVVDRGYRIGGYIVIRRTSRGNLSNSMRAFGRRVSVRKEGGKSSFANDIRCWWWWWWCLVCWSLHRNGSCCWRNINPCDKKLEVRSLRLCVVTLVVGVEVFLRSLKKTCCRGEDVRSALVEAWSDCRHVSLSLRNRKYCGLGFRQASRVQSL